LRALTIFLATLGAVLEDALVIAATGLVGFFANFLAEAAMGFLANFFGAGGFALFLMRGFLADAVGTLALGLTAGFLAEGLDEDME
jgi:hypothetical protein